MLCIAGCVGGKDFIVLVVWFHKCSGLSCDELPKIGLGLFVCLAGKLSYQWIGREAQIRVISTFQKTKQLIYICVCFYYFCTFKISKYYECYSDSYGGIRTPE